MLECVLQLQFYLYYFYTLLSSPSLPPPFIIFVNIISFAVRLGRLRGTGLAGNEAGVAGSRVLGVEEGGEAAATYSRQEVPNRVSDTSLIVFLSH